MNLKLVIDMNLSPEWRSYLGSRGWPRTHWSDIGDPKASDRFIMDWAVADDHVVFTHDMDFVTILALTHARGPSVVQVRGMTHSPIESASRWWPHSIAMSRNWSRAA